MTILDVLVACVTGPYIVEYQHPATDRWVPLSRRYDDCREAIENAKKIHHKARVVTAEGRVLWTS